MDRTPITPENVSSSFHMHFYTTTTTKMAKQSLISDTTMYGIMLG